MSRIHSKIPYSILYFP